MNKGHIGYSPDFKSETHKANIKITKMTKAKPPKLEDEYISKLLAGWDKLIEALDKYGKHDMDCPSSRGGMIREEARPCTCGLDAVLAEMKEPG